MKTTFSTSVRERDKGGRSGIRRDFCLNLDMYFLYDMHARMCVGEGGDLCVYTCTRRLQPRVVETVLAHGLCTHTCMYVAQLRQVQILRLQPYGGGDVDEQPARAEPQCGCAHVCRRSLTGPRQHDAHRPAPRLPLAGVPGRGPWRSRVEYGLVWGCRQSTSDIGAHAECWRRGVLDARVIARTLPCVARHDGPVQRCSPRLHRVCWWPVCGSSAYQAAALSAREPILPT